MGVIHKDVVQYTWTARDQLIAQMWPKHLTEGAKVEDRYVTPYRILPSSLPDCKKWKVGDSVPIPLDKSGERWAVNLFFVDGCEWVEIPAEVKGYKTISELCAKLYAHNPNRFLGTYYDWSKKTAKAKSDAAQLLFDYWKNSAYRNASLQAGFSYTEPRYPERATEHDGQKLRWVLAKKPILLKAPVAPGSQTLQMEDAQMGALAVDILEMRHKAARILELLRMSETIMRGRLTLAQRFKALNALVEVCANSRIEANPEAFFLANTTRALEKKVLDALKTKPLSELIKESHAPLDLMVIIRKNFGFTDDIVGEIRRLGLELVEKLTADPDFAARCGKWAQLALKKDWRGTPAFETWHQKLVTALVEVLAALQEVDTPHDFSEKLFEILERVPHEPITDDNAIVKIGNRSALDVALALAGPTIGLTTTSVGNTPGPPSLYIAVVQLRATKKIMDAVSAGAGTQAAAATLRNELIGQLRRALGADTMLAKELENAIRTNDQEALLKMRTRVLDGMTGEMQASRSAKLGIVLLQVLAFAMAYSAASQKETLEVADVLGLVGSGATLFVPVVDLAATFANKTISIGMSKLSMGLGAFSFFLGIVLSTMQMADASKNDDQLGVIAAGLSVLGNFCLMIGGVSWFTVAIPGLNVAGLVLLAASVTLSLTAVAIDEATPKTRKMARAILASITSHPMYDLLREEPEIRDWMATITDKIETVFLPQPPYNNFVVEQLAGAGFRKSEIGLIVEETGAPLMAGTGLTAAH